MCVTLSSTSPRFHALSARSTLSYPALLSSPHALSVSLCLCYLWRMPCRLAGLALPSLAPFRFTLSSRCCGVRSCKQLHLSPASAAGRAVHGCQRGSSSVQLRCLLYACCTVCLAGLSCGSVGSQRLPLCGTSISAACTAQACKTTTSPPRRTCAACRGGCRCTCRPSRAAPVLPPLRPRS